MTTMSRRLAGLTEKHADVVYAYSLASLTYIRLAF